MNAACLVRIVFLLQNESVSDVPYGRGASTMHWRHVSVMVYGVGSPRTSVGSSMNGCADSSRRRSGTVKPSPAQRVSIPPSWATEVGIVWQVRLASIFDRRRRIYGPTSQRFRPSWGQCPQKFSVTAPLWPRAGVGATMQDGRTTVLSYFDSGGQVAIVPGRKIPVSRLMVRLLFEVRTRPSMSRSECAK